MTAVLLWLRKWWKLVAGAIGSAVVVGVGAALALGAYQRKVVGLRDAVEVEKAKGQIAALRGRREELLAQDEADDFEVARLDTALEENRLAIEAARRRADVPDEELADEFARLGY